MQSTGAMILHTACLLAERRGIEIVAPIHDAFVAQCDARDVEDVSAALDRVMRDASAVVLRGYELPTDCRSSGRASATSTSAAAAMWETVSGLLAKRERESGVMTDGEDLSGLFLEFEGDPLAPVKTARRQPKPKQRHFGCPLAFAAEVCRRTKGRATLIVAIYVYRRTSVCETQTVTLPAAALAELGIDRRRKREALNQLQAAGLISVERITGHSTRVTLTWQPE